LVNLLALLCIRRDRQWASADERAQTFAKTGFRHLPEAIETILGTQTATGVGGVVAPARQ
jgi:hypothetical protein